MSTLVIDEVPNGWIIYNRPPHEGHMSEIVAVFNSLHDLTRFIEHHWRDKEIKEML